MRPTSAPFSPALAAALLVGPLVTACGKGDGPKPPNALSATLDYIRQNGFPKLADLKPSLPAQLARISGVDTDEAGMPVVPDNLGEATFGDSSAAINKVLADATELSTQGFSEARRLEAVLENLATPVYDLLGNADLFAATGSTGGAQGLITTQGAAAGAASVFDDLADVLTYAIDTGGENGMPSYVVLAGSAATGTIDISGLWPDAGNFLTGFRARVRLAGVDDFSVDLTLAPARISGLIPKWQSQSCADDLWQVTIGATPGDGRSLSVKSHECPAERDALSTLSLASLDDGTWSLQGGFAQSYADADEDTLRGFLGVRQGFVVQAASPSSLDRLAAAAAILGEPDFAAPSQETIDEFGIGQVVARYFQAKYFDPRRKKAKDGSIFTNYDNVAYWTCYADVVADAVADEVPTVKDLCKGEDIDIDATLGVVTALNDAIAGESLVPSNVKKTVKALVDVLTIRNTLFVGTDADVHYKVAPDEDFEALDTKRKAALPAALSDTSWKDESSRSLPSVQKSEVPDSPLKALASGVESFLKKKCQALVGDATTKAGKTADASDYCG
jgi:hypothetical protein